MPGSIWKKAFDIALDQYGFITHKDFKTLNTDPVLLRQWCQRGLVTRVGHGIYRFPEVPATPLDSLMLATLWPAGRGVLSHDSALELHDLCDINPAKVHVSIPANYRLRRKGGELFVFYKENISDSEIIWYEGIRIVTPYLAIKQALKSNVPIHLIRQAMDEVNRKRILTKKQFALITKELEQLQ